MFRKLLSLALAIVLPASSVSAAEIPVQRSVEWGNGSKLVTLRLKGVPVREALQMLAEEHSVNLMVDPSVTGMVSLDFKETRLDRVLDTILRTNGLAMQRVGSSYFVYRSGLYGDQAVKAFRLVNSNAAHVAMVLNKVLALNGGSQNNASASAIAPSMEQTSIIADTQSNSLLVKAAPPRVSLIEQLINQLDVSIPSKLYRLKYLTAVEAVQLLRAGLFPVTSTAGTPGEGTVNGMSFELGVGPVDKLDPLSRTKTSVAVGADLPRLIPLSRDSNSLVVFGTPDQFALIEQMLPKIDRKLPQVMIRTRVLEIYEKKNSDLGLTVGGSAGGLTASFGKGTDQSFKFSYGTMAVNAAQVDVSINALVQAGKAKILANPAVLAMDSRRSVIRIVDDIIAQTSTTTTTNANNVIITKSVVPGTAGITLDILPRINDDGEISLAVHPTISFVRDTVTQGQDIVATLKSTRDYQTEEIRVKAGNTIQIGGLIQDRTQTNETKIPFLGDLPFLGAMFRREQKSQETTEVMVFITPELVQDDASAAL